MNKKDGKQDIINYFYLHFIFCAGLCSDNTHFSLYCPAPERQAFYNSLHAL